MCVRVCEGLYEDYQALGGGGGGRGTTEDRDKKNYVFQNIFT